MTDTMRKFLEEASKDKEFTERLSKAETPDAVITLAVEKGFTLTEEDMERSKTQEGEISDDEVEAVAGGKSCYCAVGGGGTGGGNDDTCWCVTAGLGMDNGDNENRCTCVVAGHGKSLN